VVVRQRTEQQRSIRGWKLAVGRGVRGSAQPSKTDDAKVEVAAAVVIAATKNSAQVAYSLELVSEPVQEWLEGDT
jgi:hypothetical protein